MIVADDIAPEIAGLRTGAQEDAAAARLLEKYAPKAVEPKSDSVVATSPASSFYTDATANPQITLNYADAAGKAPQPEKQDDDGFWSAAGAVAKDVGRGILETPRNIVGGARDAIQATIYDPINDLATWLEEQIPLGGFVMDDQGFRYVDKVPDANFNLPEIRKAESTTGGLVRGMSQWLTAWFGPGKFITKGMKPTTTAGVTGKAMVQGAVADFAGFEEQEKRLSNVINEYAPELANPVTEYLAASDDDGFFEGRMKNAIEGAGLGAITEGVIHGLRALRNAKIARDQTRQAKPSATRPDQRPELNQDAFDVLGDESAPLLATRTPHDMVVAQEGRAAGMGVDEVRATTDAAEEPETYINFARIDAPEDVQNVMQSMADSLKGDVDAARRGERMSFKQMELSAEQEDAFKVLAERRQGQPLNAEQSVAARQLWASSASKLAEVSKIAAENPSAANLFAFRRMVAVHAAIQSEVIAARTETARALASWRIPAGSGADRFAEIENALRASGDGDFRLSQEMAKRMAKLSDAGMATEFDAIARGSVWARSRDAFLEVWVNGLLSGPQTHLVNMMSNTGVAFQQMYERAAAAQLARALGHNGSVEVGEAMSQLFGMISGVKDGLRYAAKTLRTNQSGYGMGKIDLDMPHARAISSEAWNVAKDTPLGRTVDVIGVTATLPGRFLAAEDEFFKTIGYRMELNSLALRRATQELNAGTIQPDQFKARIAEIVENPPNDIRLDAIDQATYQTFTSAPGNITRRISGLVNAAPAIGRLIMPFIRTPGNILRYTFERTPLAPLMSHVRADIAAGGARRDIALARVATGSMLMAASADMAMNESITGKGPSDRAERQALERTGWQPYSLKVGDRYYAYNRLDPIGSLLGLSADMVEILSNMEDNDDLSDAEVESAYAAVAMSAANNLMNKTYMSGVSDLITAMSDPERYGRNYFQRFAGSVVPTGVANVARAMDPYSLEANTMLERIRSRVPGLSQDLPLRRDLWGRPISYRSGLGAIYDTFSPIYSRRENPEPIDTEMLRLGETIEGAFVTMPSRTQMFNGVRVNLDNYPGAYSRFVELAGNGTTSTQYGAPAGGKGAKDYLNSVVQGEGPGAHTYRLKSNEGKAEYIKSIISRYRKAARSQLLGEYPGIVEHIEIEIKNARKRELDALSTKNASPSAQ